MACVSRSSDTHHLLLIGSIQYHLDQGTCTTCSWWDKIEHHLNTLALLLLLLDINLRWNAHASLHDWTYLKKILHHGHYWLLAGISSHSTTVLDKRSWFSDTQQHHWEGLHSFLLEWLCPAPVICWRRNIIQSLSDHTEWCLQMGATSEDIRNESQSKSLSVPTPLHQEPWPFHVSTQENLSFGPATSIACPSPGYLHAVCHQLAYEEDNESSLDPRMEDHSPEDDILAPHLPSITEEEDDDIEEHFPTVSLDDDFWVEEPVPERHLCIHENSHVLCPYPCPYSLNPLHLAQEDAPQYIDLNDIFEFPNVIVSTNDDDVPSLEDILRL